jgi:Uma2 family endonuclease
LPDDGKRYEIIGGELIMSPGASHHHQRISHLLEYKLEDYIQEHQSGEIIDVPFDVVLSMTDVVQPDLMYISNERSHIIAENNTIAAPDLVVEIISESTKTIDQTRKKALYEEYGVKEYWIIYPNEEKVEQFILQDEQFVLNETFEKTETLNTKIIPGFSVSLTQIFTT